MTTTTVRPIAVVLWGKRIEKRHAGSSDIPDVASYKSEAVHLCGGRQQSVDEWQGIGNAESRPNFSNGFIDWQDAIGEAGSHLPEPPVE